MDNNTRTQGGTNYHKWNKITNSLITETEKEEELEKEAAAEALGHNRVPHSSAQAEEQAKAEIARKSKEALDQFQQRESNATAFLDDLIPSKSDASKREDSKESEHSNTDDDANFVKEIDEAMLGKKRVISIRNCRGPGEIILPRKLSALSMTTSITNDKAETSKINVQGVIKLFIHNCHDCTIRIQCKIITSMVEITHCSNVSIVVEHEKMSTIQMDLSENIVLCFKGLKCFGGKDDKIYHAGVSNSKIQLMEEDRLQ